MKTSEGGGAGDEHITVRRMVTGDVFTLVEAPRAAGVAVDIKLLTLSAGLALG